MISAGLDRPGQLVDTEPPADPVARSVPTAASRDIHHSGSAGALHSSCMVEGGREQTAALLALLDEYGADRWGISDRAHGSLWFVMFRDDSEQPVCMGTISVAGTVRTEGLVIR